MDDDFVFISLEKVALPVSVNGKGEKLANIRVHFIYRGKPGYGDVHITQSLADDPRFNLVDIATTIIKQELWRQENKERDVSIVWDKKERQ